MVGSLFGDSGTAPDIFLCLEVNHEGFTGSFVRLSMGNALLIMLLLCIWTKIAGIIGQRILNGAPKKKI